MDIIIIEDEAPALEKLKLLLSQCTLDFRILATIQNVADGKIIFQNLNIQPQLIFADIQLPDGNCFDIFNELQSSIPVVFITAYDNYMLKAFENYGLDYLLKPYTLADLQRCCTKIKNLETVVQNWNSQKLVAAAKIIASNSNHYRSRFLIKCGDHLKAIPTPEIALFYAEGRDVYLVTSNVNKYIIDFSLETLEEELNPMQFFRINRTFIVNIEYIADVILYSSSRLQLKIKNFQEAEIIVSRSRVNEFKNWFDGILPDK